MSWCFVYLFGAWWQCSIIRVQVQDHMLLVLYGLRSIWTWSWLTQSQTYLHPALQHHIFLWSVHMIISVLLSLTEAYCFCTAEIHMTLLWNQNPFTPKEINCSDPLLVCLDSDSTWINQMSLSLVSLVYTSLHSSRCLSEISFRHRCWGHCIYDVHHRFSGFLVEVVDWLGCRQNILSDLCCDHVAPGLNIWLSPQAPSSSLRLYDGLSIAHWSPVTLQGLVRTAGLSLMTYSQRHISGHVATLVLDLANLAWTTMIHSTSSFSDPFWLTW